jgi:hypothetical protein
LSNRDEYVEIKPPTPEPLDHRVDPTFIPIFQSDADSLSSEGKTQVAEPSNPVVLKKLSND